MTRSEIVGENIRKYRTARGMSQVDFAIAIDRSQPMVAMYERGQRLPSTKILAKCANVLGVAFDELYYGENESEDGEMDAPVSEYSPDERRLVDLYRNAIPQIQTATIQLLEMNQVQKKEHHAC